MPHSSVDDTLTALQLQNPNRTFLALGQTVFWDEPVKAVWRRILDRHWPAAQVVAGIHDTDYFAKTTAHIRDDQQFVALAHDDGATRGLWSAAGELSAFLGSEDLPSRAFFESLGIPFDQLAGRHPEHRRQFFSEFTSAYGWRGVVQTTGVPQIAHDVPLTEFGPALLELLTWGFNQSLANFFGETKHTAGSVCETISFWVKHFLESCRSSSTLVDLYQYLLPKFYELLLDFEPSNFSVTATSQLLKFNTQTAGLPRFAIVDVFLNPKTRELARGAYSKAVAGGGMYTLDNFSEGALPFDVIVFGRGRGTLHVLDDHLLIDFEPEPQVIETPSTVTDTVCLASVLSNNLGPDVVLVGKAVTLIDMLSAEFTLIFHETASGYTERTAAMNGAMRAADIELPQLSPILRLQYNTWDALVHADQTEILLPDHLSAAFQANGSPIKAPHFGRQWRSAVKAHQTAIYELSDKRRVRDLASYLQNIDGSGFWIEKLNLYESCLSTLRAKHEEHASIRQEIQDIDDRINSLRGQRDLLERESGLDYHARLLPLQNQFFGGDTSVADEIRQAEDHRLSAFSAPIAMLASHIRRLRGTRKALVAQKRAAERFRDIRELRQTVSDITVEANLAKLSLARSAFLTVHGLPHTNSRPSAWWFPLVDPSGAWFDALTNTVEARLEEL